MVGLNFRVHNGSIAYTQLKYNNHFQNYLNSLLSTKNEYKIIFIFYILKHA